MKLWGVYFALCCIAAPALRSADRTPHETYDQLNALRLDSGTVYTITSSARIELRKGDARISFEEGKMAFFLPLDGRISGVAFAGRGHVLSLPRDAIEKQQLARFLGVPVLDQYFSQAYLRFTDDTAEELLRQLNSAKIIPQSDVEVAGRWVPTITALNPSHSLRIIFSMLSKNAPPYFFASLDGFVSGPFDVVLDFQRNEQFMLGQTHTKNGMASYDVWASHKIPDSAASATAFHALQYTIDTTIFPNRSLQASANIKLRAETDAERLLIFQLSRALAVDSVTDDNGQQLAFFQNEGLTAQERSVRGNDYLYVVLPVAAVHGSEFTLHFHYRGSVIEDAGNGVLFVGSRESWYPHFGDSADFAGYDVTMRWPQALRLVATGAKVDERVEGDFRIGHWKTISPISVAGFNLGQYASAAVRNDRYSIEVFANRQLEQALKERLESTPEASENEILLHRRIMSSPVPGIANVTPSPADALKQLGKQIDASIKFYEPFSGPFPLNSLSVSQIPGSFGQGWPGLIYVSTFSFLPTEAQRRAGLSSSGQEQFTELVPFHEVAHQWWGNVVGWSSYRDQWINEAIASYLAVLFADAQKNPEHTLRVWLQRYRQNLLQQTSGADEPAGEIGALTLGSRLNSSKSPGAYESVIYSKGAWIIHMLREMLRQPGAKNPDAGFVALLNTLASKYAYRALSTEDLQREVERVMTPAMDLEGGRSMEWFFEEWVKGTGIPHYRVQFTVSKTEKGYEVRGKLFQTGVPHSFIARVPIFSSSAGTRPVHLGSIIAVGEETLFRFTTANAPRKLLIDPQMTLLCSTE